MYPEGRVENLRRTFIGTDKVDTMIRVCIPDNPRYKFTLWKPYIYQAVATGMNQILNSLYLSGFCYRSELLLKATHLLWFTTWF